MSFLLRKFFSILSRDDLDNILIAKMKAIKREPLFHEEDRRLYIKHININGYDFLKLKIVSRIEIVTDMGCRVKFITDEGSFVLESEYQEIEGSYSEKSKLGITDFDLDLNEAFKEFLQTNELKRVELFFIPKNNEEEQQIVFATLNEKILTELRKSYFGQE